MADDDHIAPGTSVPATIDPYRDDLIAPCRHWSGKLQDEVRDTIVAAIVDSFWNWRDRQADSNGNVKLISQGGLLSPLTEKTVPTADVEPWQCGGPLVKNDIDLAFKLWLDNDPDFAAVISAHGLETVFALIGIWSAKAATRNSLIRINGFLVQSLLFELGVANRVGKELFDEHKTRDRQARESLARARDKRNQDRAKAAAEKKRQYRQVAYEYVLHNPTADQSSVIKHLKTVDLPKLATSTIKRLIAGVMGEARKASKPKPSLYATEQRSIR